MAHTEKCRGCIFENRCDYITCKIDEANYEIDLEKKEVKRYGK